MLREVGSAILCPESAILYFNVKFIFREMLIYAENMGKIPPYSIIQLSLFLIYLNPPRIIGRDDPD
ncbi:protein of unknown function [Brevefilum fermentans]|uniref:Uncharacterized protein n=1 Tax=Candidatus Brevifilum fermentans TaxID=1986204 RepID=A0A1Y6K513_9CHLR|nr:protein of unknown function [Brevefilum fermentans]